MKIYGIYTAWSDCSENQAGKAFGYDLEGVTMNEDKARAICDKAGLIPAKVYGWAADTEVGKPIKYYKEIPVLAD